MADVTIETPDAQFQFSGTGFSPADAATNYDVGTPTQVNLTLSGVADNAGRQSDKADLGANRAPRYAVHLAVDFTGETPVIGERVDVFWASSTSATAANANVAGNSGVDGVAPNGALGTITLDEFIAQCEWLGTLIIHDGASVQNAEIGVLIPKTRYGQIIVVNRSGDVFEADNVEMSVWLTPMVDDVSLT